MVKTKIEETKQCYNLTNADVTLLNSQHKVYAVDQTYTQLVRVIKVPGPVCQRAQHKVSTERLNPGKYFLKHKTVSYSGLKDSSQHFQNSPFRPIKQDNICGSVKAHRLLSEYLFYPGFVFSWACFILDKAISPSLRNGSTRRMIIKTTAALTLVTLHWLVRLL